MADKKVKEASKLSGISEDRKRKRMADKKVKEASKLSAISEDRKFCTAVLVFLAP
jgi:hypothetical protein